MAASILVVDDERDFLESIKRGLATRGFRNTRIEDDPRNVPLIIEKSESFDIALIDINMPHINGTELLETLKEISPTTEVIMITAIDEARVAVGCLKKGAYDYLVKPFSREDLVSSIDRALERKRLVDILDIGRTGSIPKLKHADVFRPIVTRSERVLKTLKEAELHAESNVPILITGESGTGKDLLAKAIHGASHRAKFPFTAVNMASLTENIFDAEFFGHTKGAFTGAEKDRKGYLETANQGTLFLDEIGALPVALQGKLLRALQDGEFMKIGTSAARKTDVRFIAATNSDLGVLLAKGLFRKDLYYRLRGGLIHLPALRERKEDIPLLLNRFLEEFAGLNEGCGIEEDAMALFMNYDYPGNIRELRSIIQSALNLGRGKTISTNSLPSFLKKRKPNLKAQDQLELDHIIPLKEFEKDYILKVYNNLSQNKSKTAKLLGIGLNTLRRKLEAYGLR